MARDDRRTTWPSEAPCFAVVPIHFRALKTFPGEVMWHWCRGCAPNFRTNYGRGSLPSTWVATKPESSSLMVTRTNPCSSTE